MINTYLLTQYFDDGISTYPSYTLSVNAETPDEARQLAQKEDTHHPRNKGWSDAQAVVVAWATGEFPKKGILV